MLAPNAVSVLDKIVGVEAAIRPKGFSFDAIHVHTHDATTLTPVGGMRLSDPKGDHRSLSLYRPTLHQALVDVCKEYPDWIDVQWGKKLITIDESKDGVKVHFEDGTSADGE